MDNQQKTIDAFREDVVTAAVELFEGDRRAAEAWLNQPLRAIGDEVPALYMDSPEKFRKYATLLAGWSMAFGHRLVTRLGTTVFFRVTA